MTELEPTEPTYARADEHLSAAPPGEDEDFSVLGPDDLPADTDTTGAPAPFYFSSDPVVF